MKYINEACLIFIEMFNTKEYPIFHDIPLITEYTFTFIWCVHRKTTFEQSSTKNIIIELFCNRGWTLPDTDQWNFETAVMRFYANLSCVIGYLIVDMWMRDMFSIFAFMFNYQESTSMRCSMCNFHFSRYGIGGLTRTIQN